MALAESLPDVVLASKAPNTSSKYSAAFARWKTWASSHQLPHFPASPTHVVLYLRFLMLEAKTAAPIESAINGIAWVHKIAGEQTPTDHSLVKEVVAGAKRLLAHQKVRKEPITVDQLGQLVVNKAGPLASLYDIRSVSLCLLAFAAFLRFDELSRLIKSDVQFFEDHLEIFIEHSKTDQFRDGENIPIAKSGKSTCPVAMLARYLEMAHLSDGSHLYCQLSKSKFGYKPRARALGLSYSRFRELVIEAFLDIVPDVKQIGTHSLRSGGASTAARAGVSDRLFKRHGRWISENAKDGYIKDSLEDRLSVTKALGL